MATEEKHEADAKAPGKSKVRRLPLKKLIVTVALVLLAVVVFAGSYIYAVSSGPIRNPKMEHAHFRMQLEVDGKAVDFGGQAFQTPYAKDQCSDDLSAQPIHFHDQKNQFVHVHWAYMTGGMVLKNYGWNFVGGKDNLLGYRLDNLPSIKSVPVHGNNLPDVPADAKFWVYTGDENGYQKKSFDEFKSQDLEKFFDNESNFPKTTWGGDIMDKVFPKASAHAGESHDTVLSVSGDETEVEQLTRINNLLGNVVIFVQKDEPSDSQIKAKFADLEPMSTSTCGG